MTNLRAELYIKGIVSNEKYIEIQNEPPSPNRTLRAIGTSALALAQEGTKENGYRTHEADVYFVISKIDSFATSQAKLDKLRDKGARRSEKIPFLREVIEFNHAVKDMVNNDPSLRFSDVIGFITNMYIRAHANFKDSSQEDRRSRIEWFYNSCRSSLNGMRHELGFERILGQIEDIEYRETNIDDELKGVDYYITKNGITFPIDIKASETSVRESQHTSLKPNNIVWSHCNSRDFDDSFHISPELAKQKANDVRQVLQHAYLAA